MYSKFIEHSIKSFPCESVALVYGGAVHIVENISKSPCDSFSVSSKELLKANLSGLTEILHSHTNSNAEASNADKVGIKLTGVKWVIISVDSEKLLEVKTYDKN